MSLHSFTKEMTCTPLINRCVGVVKFTVVYRHLILSHEYQYICLCCLCVCCTVEIKLWINLLPLLLFNTEVTVQCLVQIFMNIHVIRILLMEPWGVLKFLPLQNWNGCIWCRNWQNYISVTNIMATSSSWRLIVILSAIFDSNWAVKMF